jgi:tetratricopeptide (TPR) repeat protein
MKKLFIYILLSASLLAGCKGSQTASAPSKPPGELDNIQKAEVTSLFFNASKEKILGNLNNAANLYAEVIRKDNNNACAMYEISNIYSEQKKNADALFFAKGAYLIDHKNSWYVLSYADILQKNRKFNEAAEVLNKLVLDYPDHPDYYFEWASALIYADKPGEAIKAYDKLEARIGISKEVSMQKSRLYQRMKKNEKAIEELKRLIANDPADVQSYGMLAEVYQAMGDNAKALETYNKVLELDPLNPYIHLSLADYYRKNGEKEKSQEELKKAFGNKELDVETKISILGSYYSLIELHPELIDQALEMCRLLISSHPDEPRAHAVYGDFLYQNKKTQEALVEYRKAKDLGAKDFYIYQKLLSLELELKEIASLEKDCDEAMTLFPDQPLVYFLNGLAKAQLKKYNDAVTSYNSGLKMVVDNVELQVQFYASLGEAYNELHDFINSDKSFEKALDLKPKDANTLNNYAYFLSVRGERLEKAEEMSRLSNELEPTQGSYQDTYAWIMYRLGKYDDAKIWIEKSISNTQGNNATLLEHYGDILFKLGDTAKAIETWQKAKDAGDGASEFLDRKILEKKIFE